MHIVQITQWFVLLALELPEHSFPMHLASANFVLFLSRQIFASKLIRAKFASKARANPKKISLENKFMVVQLINVVL